MTRFFIVMVVALISGLNCFAQQPLSPWAGEWGEFHLLSPDGPKQYQGERLLISDCAGQTCKLAVSVAGDANGNCGTTDPGTLHIQSASTATADLGANQCTLALRLGGTSAVPAISANPGTGDCSYFCTSGINFNHQYPLHARTEYLGDNIQACYAGTSRAQMAICSNADLVKQQKDWLMLSLQLADLEQTKFAMPSDSDMFVSKCDSANDPAACLHSIFAQATLDLKQKQQAWITQVTTPGSVVDAAPKLAAVAGRYRHSFMSGDVQGESFKVTDRLQISKVSPTSVHYSLELNFYNGHTCSKSGTAVYMRNGTFLDEVKENSGEECFFQIVPGKAGVKLRDPNGVCKMNDCGARGGFNSAGFSYADKLRSIK